MSRPILFLEDWERYPSAIIDDTTKNTSFVDFAKLLKSMGAENYFFALALIQPELKGIDPHNENLSDSIRLKIALEVEYNPWYFFREVLKIPSGSKNPVMFRANRAVISLIWCFLVNIDYTIVIPRQNGKSTTIDGIDLWLLFFKLFGAEIFLFTKDDDLRARNIKRLKETRDELPLWLCPHTKKDANNSESLTCIARNNILRTAIGQPTVKGADKVGVGLTFAISNIDESPKITNVHISLPAMLAASTAARDNAELAGTPYGNMLSTTAGRLDTIEGAYMFAYITNSMIWDEMLYDLSNRFEAHKVVREHSKDGSLRINGTFNHRQVGRDDEWLKEMRRLVGGSVDNFARDFLNQWTRGQESSPIEQEILDVITQSESEPAYTYVTAEKYTVRWYIKERDLEEHMANNDTILTMDSGEGVGRDYNALTIENTSDLSVIGASSINEANTFKYAGMIAYLLIKYPRMTWIFENKSSGQSICDAVATILISHGIDPFRRIYNKVVDESETMADAYNEICKQVSISNDKLYVKYKKYFGFKTNGSNREFLYDIVLTDAVKSTGHLVKDSHLISEITGLVSKNGRVDHVKGAHDDMVISWLLGHWFIKHSKNLKFYGIDTSRCLVDVTSNGAVMTPEQAADKRLLFVLLQEISALKEKLVSSPNVIAAMTNERILAYKISQAQGLGDMALSLDGIMQEVKDRQNSNNDLKRNLNKFMEGNYRKIYNR